MKPTADRCQIQVCPPGMVSWMVGRPGAGGVGGAVERWRLVVCVCVYVFVGGGGGGIDRIRGKEELAVSQLDLLILQPWGKGVCVCVYCACLIEICQV